MQEFGKKQEVRQPSALLESARVRILDAHDTTPASEVVHQPEPLTHTQPAAPEQVPSHQEVRETQTSLNLSLLQTTLVSLDNEQLQQVLGQLSAYQLASALERLLKPISTAPLQTPDAGTNPVEKRKSDRSKTFRAGKMIYNNNMSTNNCEIRDLSETGCRVTVDSTIGIPDHFALHIVNGDVKYECEVAWRKSDAMGLKFIG